MIKKKILKRDALNWLLMHFLHQRVTKVGSSAPQSAFGCLWARRGREGGHSLVHLWSLLSDIVVEPSPPSPKMLFHASGWGEWRCVLSQTAGLFLLTQLTCIGFAPFNGLGQQPRLFHWLVYQCVCCSPSMRFWKVIISKRSGCSLHTLCLLHITFIVINTSEKISPLRCISKQIFHCVLLML